MILLAVLLAAGGVAPAKSVAGPVAGDVEWPCDVTPRATLSVSDYWPDIDRKSLASSADPTMTALAQTVARRNLEEDDAVAQVRRYVADHPHVADRALLAQTMAETVDDERKVIIDGIRRFNIRQGQLAKRIEEGYSAMDAPAATLTPERKAALEDQAQWDQRIFEDRQRMLPIVCRQPAALEKRLSVLIGAVKGR